MLCPSDTYNRKPFMGSMGSETTALGDNWARGNYAANGGLLWLSSDSGRFGADWCGGSKTDQGSTNPLLRGIMGSGWALTAQKVTDGLAHTILLGEIRAGLTQYDPRGVWAMSGACPSSLWACGNMVGDDKGPNDNADALADDCQNCQQLWNDMGGGPAVQALGMSCSNGDWPNWQQTIRSMHSNGAYVALADGGVHFVSDEIDIGTDPSNPSTYEPTYNPSIWERLIVSGDGKQIPSNWDQ